MSHMVIFRSADGKPGYHQAESLDEAVRFVEHLRNQEGVTDTRLFNMQEIPLEVRTYYRVEVASSVDAAPVVEEAERAVGIEVRTYYRVEVASSVDAAPVVEEAERAVGMMDDPVVVEPMSAGNGQGAAAGRFNRFNRT